MTAIATLLGFLVLRPLIKIEKPKGPLHTCERYPIAWFTAQA